MSEAITRHHGLIVMDLGHTYLLLMQPISSVTSLSPTAGTETTAAMDAAFIYTEI
jgi:hypothetical protein